MVLQRLGESNLNRIPNRHDIHRVFDRNQYHESMPVVFGHEFWRHACRRMLDLLSSNIHARSMHHIDASRTLRRGHAPHGGLVHDSRRGCGRNFHLFSSRTFSFICRSARMRLRFGWIL